MRRQGRKPSPPIKPSPPRKPSRLRRQGRKPSPPIKPSPPRLPSPTRQGRKDTQDRQVIRPSLTNSNSSSLTNRYMGIEGHMNWVRRCPNGGGDHKSVQNLKDFKKKWIPDANNNPMCKYCKITCNRGIEQEGFRSPWDCNRFGFDGKGKAIKI